MREDWNFLNLTKRNLGLISRVHQDILRGTPIAILGTGGLGGSLAEQLIRSGCEHLVLVDNDKFEFSNLNRQLCTLDDIGKYKVDVLENLFKKINPNVQIKTFKQVNIKNISSILKDVRIAALTLDDPFVSILVSRECVSNKIPFIESFGLPVMWAWWFTPSSISYEEFYNFGTEEYSSEELKIKEDLKEIYYEAMMKKFVKIPRVIRHYAREEGVLEEIMAGERNFPIMAPIIRITASYMCYELIFTGLLHLKKMIHPPYLKGFDYFRMKSVDITLE